MKFQSQKPPAGVQLRRPKPSCLPVRPELLISARYRESRLGGDFYDFVEINENRVLFTLLDIAGKKDEALHVAAAAQDVFRARGVELLGSEDLNVADAITDLLLEMNRAIIAAANGVRCTPAFLGCYDREFGLVHYCNAGHPPAFVKDDEGVSLLESNGLPLGLFSHATHDAQVSALSPGAALVMISRGLIETRNRDQEFGSERVRQILTNNESEDAYGICSELLAAVEEFAGAPRRLLGRLPFFRNGQEANDTTVVALMRARKTAAVAAN
jgi:serine phosphatase RsbU (regulator of sigma subunit)